MKEEIGMRKKSVANVFITYSKIHSHNFRRGRGGEIP